MLQNRCISSRVSLRKQLARLPKASWEWLSPLVRCPPSPAGRSGSIGGRWGISDRPPSPARSAGMTLLSPPAAQEEVEAQLPVTGLLRGARTRRGLRCVPAETRLLTHAAPKALSSDRVSGTSSDSCHSDLGQGGLRGGGGKVLLLELDFLFPREALRDPQMRGRTQRALQGRVKPNAQHKALDRCALVQSEPQPWPSGRRGPWCWPKGPRLMHPVSHPEDAVSLGPKVVQVPDQSPRVGNTFWRARPCTPPMSSRPFSLVQSVGRPLFPPPPTVPLGCQPSAFSSVTPRAGLSCWVELFIWVTEGRLPGP